MKRNNDILNELREISPLLADAPVSMPFSVPETYFSDLADMVEGKIQVQELLQPVNPYQVPNGYFEGLSAQILSGIQDNKAVSDNPREELEPIAPLLNTIDKLPPYTIPAGYFEAVDFTDATKPFSAPAGIFTLRSIRRFTQYAAAAVVAGVLVTGAFLFTDKDSSVEPIKKDRFNIPVQTDSQANIDVAKPDTATADNGSDMNKETADDELPAANTIKEVLPAHHDIKLRMQTLTEEEMKKYLEENAIPEPVIPEATETEDSL